MQSIYNMPLPQGRLQQYKNRIEQPLQINPEQLSFIKSAAQQIYTMEKQASAAVLANPMGALSYGWDAIRRGTEGLVDTVKGGLGFRTSPLDADIRRIQDTRQLPNPSVEGSTEPSPIRTTPQQTITPIEHVSTTPEVTPDPKGTPTGRRGSRRRTTTQKPADVASTPPTDPTPAVESVQKDVEQGRQQAAQQKLQTKSPVVKKNSAGQTDPSVVGSATALPQQPAPTNPAPISAQARAQNVFGSLDPQSLDAVKAQQQQQIPTTPQPTITQPPPTQPTVAPQTTAQPAAVQDVPRTKQQIRQDRKIVDEILFGSGPEEVAVKGQLAANRNQDVQQKIQQVTGQPSTQTSMLDKAKGLFGFGAPQLTPEQLEQQRIEGLAQQAIDSGEVSGEKMSARERIRHEKRMREDPAFAESYKKEQMDKATAYVKDKEVRDRLLADVEAVKEKVLRRKEIESATPQQPQQTPPPQTPQTGKVLKRQDRLIHNITEDAVNQGSLSLPTQPTQKVVEAPKPLALQPPQAGSLALKAPAPKNPRQMAELDAGLDSAISSFSEPSTPPAQQAATNRRQQLDQQVQQVTSPPAQTVSTPTSTPHTPQQTVSAPAQKLSPPSMQTSTPTQTVVTPPAQTPPSQTVHAPPAQTTHAPTTAPAAAQTAAHAEQKAVQQAEQQLAHQAENQAAKATGQVAKGGGGFLGKALGLGTLGLGAYGLYNSLTQPQQPNPEYTKHAHVLEKVAQQVLLS